MSGKQSRLDCRSVYIANAVAVNTTSGVQNPNPLPALHVAHIVGATAFPASHMYHYDECYSPHTFPLSFPYASPLLG